MPLRTGRFAVIEQLLAAGIKQMFGNPGTVEQGLLDAAEQLPEFRYILALQESISVAMADGYARATKTPAVVQLHSGVGLGNGIGMMYQAMRGHAPLVVIAGDAGLRYDAMDAQMAADLVGMARPVTKYATRVTHPSSVLRVLRRAIRIAMTPPMGPVFVCLPADVLDAENTEPVLPVPALETSVAPSREVLEEAAGMLVGASSPIIIMGDGVASARAEGELARVAELLGAEVWGADSSEVNIPFGHPLLKGMLGHMFGATSSAVVRKADAVLIVGTYVFPEVYPDVEDVFAPGARVVHVDLNSHEIAKNFPVDLGIVSDPKLTLGGLADAISARMSEEQRRAASARIDASAAAKREARSRSLAQDLASADRTPLRASRFMEVLARRAPADAIVFDEALTVSPALTRYLVPERPGHYFQSRGGSLGVGIPGALGLKLAHPDKTVIGFTGDGGSMYTIQALWTAARYDIRAKFVICNNGGYVLLKENLLQYWNDQVGVAPHAFPDSFDLGNPQIDFSALSRSMGVAGARVSRPEEVEPAIDRMFAHAGPFLIDLVIDDGMAR
ncbi:thiamine pyrophosphate-binding protein [Sorangium sp. So ce291]|uniref:thiamine pyrophosphate-binding protein n=1 Tax=Sorangium sp. So ce291 TaxID=3133294 RepID=UPI003F5FA01E